MSAYSDWKFGGITDEQYKSICRMEAERDRQYEIEERIENELYKLQYEDEGNGGEDEE